MYRAASKQKAFPCSRAGHAKEGPGIVKVKGHLAEQDDQIPLDQIPLEQKRGGQEAVL